jgi:hypothetical protein
LKGRKGEGKEKETKKKSSLVTLVSRDQGMNDFFVDRSRVVGQPNDVEPS